MCIIIYEFIIVFDCCICVNYCTVTNNSRTLSTKDDTNSKYIEKPCETQSIEDEGYSRTTGKQQCNVEPDTNYYGNTYVGKMQMIINNVVKMYNRWK